MRFALPLALFCLTAAGHAATITTFAGTGSQGNGGDNGPATSAFLNLPVFVAADAGGNIYIADQNNHVIRKVSPAGTITTFAGTGIAGFTGDGGPAARATLRNPTGVSVQTNGSVLIADVGNQRIRRVDTTGVITTIAGNGGQGSIGDGGPATSASFYNCVRATTDYAGNIVIAEQSAHRVRRVATNGIITTIAGTGTAGFSGDGGPAAAAALNNPTAVAYDTSGNLFISDQFNHRIRRVDTGGKITTIAGTGTAGFSGDGGPAVSAALNFPGGLVVDTTGNLFFADDINFRVRQISPNGTITTVAGNGAPGFSGDGGPATSASLNGQFGVAIDPSGNLLIADSANNRIRIVTAASSVAPAFTSAGVTNGASFVTGGSAGALGTIFGQHLSVNLLGIKGASTLPIPTTLAGVTVSVNGVLAPLLAVVNANGAEQINFQMPWEAASQPNAQVVINNGVSASAPVSVQLANTQPGVFLVDGVNGAIQHLDGSLVSVAKPAAPGEYVVLFATGLGPVSPGLATGKATPASPLSTTTAFPTVTIGGLPATVLFSGEAPYFVGLNQLNIQIPAGSASGAQDLIVMSGTAANTAKIQISGSR